MRSILLPYICYLLSACAPYPVAYYSPPGQEPLQSGACNTPHSLTTMYADDHIEIKAALFGSVEPTFLLKIKDSSFVRFASSEISVSSREFDRPLQLAIRTRERRGTDILFLPASEFRGPTEVTIESVNLSTASPSELRLAIPSMELNGKKIQVPELFLRKMRVLKLVGPCQ